MLLGWQKPNLPALVPGSAAVVCVAVELAGGAVTLILVKCYTAVVVLGMD